MQALAGVFFQMGAHHGDGPLALLAIDQQHAICHDGLLILADLVALG
jgi:hypothetical protein